MRERNLLDEALPRDHRQLPGSVRAPSGPAGWNLSEPICQSLRFSVQAQACSAGEITFSDVSQSVRAFWQHLGTPLSFFRNAC